MTNRRAEIETFLSKHLQGYTQAPLAGDASFRRYIRVRADGRSLMLMDAPPERENIRPFMNVCRQLLDAGFSAPDMIAHDEARGFLLLEDLGDDTFSRLLAADISTEEDYYRASVELLAAWHEGAVTGSGLAPYDTKLLTNEVKLFSNWFLPQLLDGAALADAQASYAALWEEFFNSIPLETHQFVHRDFHADNLMWLPDRAGYGRVGLLDFQDAVAGDAAYDMVSLLEDARRDVPQALAEKMIAHYLTVAAADKVQFSFAYALLAAQRNSKIVGIFTRLAARDGKLHYLNYLPRVWAHLERDAARHEMEPLQLWLDHYVPKDKRGVITIRKDAQALGLAA